LSVSRANRCSPNADAQYFAASSANHELAAALARGFKFSLFVPEVDRQHKRLPEQRLSAIRLRLAAKLHPPIKSNRKSAALCCLLCQLAVTNLDKRNVTGVFDALIDV